MSRLQTPIRRNDTVIVTAGKDRGKKGRVLIVLPEKNRVVVEGVNLIKRHTRPSQQNRQGGIIEKEASVHASNVMVVCKKCDQPVRVGGKPESLRSPQRPVIEVRPHLGPDVLHLATEDAGTGRTDPREGLAPHDGDRRVGGPHVHGQPVAGGRGAGGPLLSGCRTATLCRGDG